MAKTTNLFFKNEQGLDLAATLEEPANAEPKAYAIFAHCFGCSKDMLAAVRTGRELTNQGFGVLRFDFTGLGKSCGQFEDTNFSTNVTDLLYAAKFLQENYQAPKILIGHSLGGAAAIAASCLIPEVEAIATIGAPSNPLHVSHLFQEHLAALAKGNIATIKIAGRELKITKQFLDDIENKCLEGILKNSKCALLIFHSPIDQIVDIDQARKLYLAAHHPKSFISLDKADHMLSNRADAEFVAKIIATWASRYIL